MRDGKLLYNSLTLLTTCWSLTPPSHPTARGKARMTLPLSLAVWRKHWQVSEKGRKEGRGQLVTQIYPGFLGYAIDVNHGRIAIEVRSSTEWPDAEIHV
jgi:hypothetical protein